KLEIDFDGAVFWNGTPIRDRGQLRELFRAAARKPIQPEIHITPNPVVEYGYVAIVLADAQKEGVQRIGFKGNERYID
ncbi:MAG: biopolymer transporter ExbD, partial [Parvularculaceae bacterium]|nr:biopolymer transporter ExbD [Parvularculaceae bacterium]